MEKSLNKNTALVVASIASFLTPFMASSINIALPSIGKEFSIDAVLLGWVATSYSLAAAMFLVPFGRLADIHGRKKIFASGVVVYSVASLLTALSTSSSFLIFFRVMQGIGAAMIFGTGVAILTSVFPPRERGKALGINVASVYLGLSLGPFLGGFLTQHLGWRSLFLVNIPIGFLILGLLFWKVKGEWAEAKGEKFDLAGSTLLSLTLVALMYGFSLLPGKAGFWLVGTSLLGMFAFLQLESKIPSPVFNAGLFKKNRVFGFSCLAALINYSATSAVSFLLSLYLQYIKGLTPQNAGIILVAQPIIMSSFSPLAGRLSDKVEPQIIASIGMGFSSFGLFLLTSLGQITPLSFIIGCLILLGFGFAFFSSPNTNAVMGSVEKKFYGVAAATLGTMRLMGQMMSLGIAMMIFSLFIGRVEIIPRYYPAFLKSAKTAFLVFAVLCLGGVFASLARGKRNQQHSG